MPKSLPLKIKTRTGQGRAWGGDRGDTAGPMKESLRLRAAPLTVAKLLPDRTGQDRQSVLGTHRTDCDTGHSQVSPG